MHITYFMATPMTQNNHRLPCVLIGEAFTTLTPDNNNWRLKNDWMTPAELMQLIRQEKERLRRELAADPRLLTCPQHRRYWDETLAFEQCALWHLFGVREA
jgi:hypothetical protein